jgi:hypothetical protein
MDPDRYCDCLFDLQGAIPDTPPVVYEPPSQFYQDHEKFLIIGIPITELSTARADLDTNRPTASLIDIDIATKTVKEWAMPHGLSEMVSLYLIPV